MKVLELEGTVRESVGKKATKALRATDSVPCVLYGGNENVHFQVTNSALRKLIYTPNVYVVDLTVGDKKVKAIMKEVQFHPVKDDVLHVDFYEVTETKPIVVEIPVRLEGLAAGVRAGGKLVQDMRKLKVKGLWTNIPDVLTINVENLGLGKTTQVKDLSFETVEIINSPNIVVAAVKLTRAARGAAAANAYF